MAWAGYDERLDLTAHGRDRNDPRNQGGLMTHVHVFAPKHRRHRVSSSLNTANVLRRRPVGGGQGYGLQALFVVAAVAFATVVVLPRPSGAADVASFPAAQGQIGSPATVVTDPTANDGQSVQFTTPTPDSAGFVHPGVLVDPSQLSFVQNEIAQGVKSVGARARESESLVHGSQLCGARVRHRRLHRERDQLHDRRGRRDRRVHLRVALLLQHGT